MHRGLPMFASLTFVFVASPAAAQERGTGNSPLLSQLVACQGIADSSARLSCYDKAAGALAAAAANGEVAIVDRQQVRNARRSLFGLGLPDFPFFSRGDKKEEEEEPKELISTLTAFRATGNDRFRFIVKDGNALWETTESARVPDPDLGDKVTIRRGFLGSYFVQIGNGRWVRARRVR